MDCPTPEKVAYRSERAARHAVKQIKRNKADGGVLLHAYRCGGHWHAGHVSQTRLPRAARRTR